jgi:hypothetical protein
MRNVTEAPEEVKRVAATPSEPPCREALRAKTPCADARILLQIAHEPFA